MLVLHKDVLFHCNAFQASASMINENVKNMLFLYIYKMIQFYSTGLMPFTSVKGFIIWILP